MVSGEMTPATEATSRTTSRLASSTPSSPPSEEAHDSKMEDAEMTNGVSESMLEEEKKLEEAALKEEEERAAAFRAERENDIHGGEEVVDPKFKRLEYLLGQSKIYSSILMSKMQQQRDDAKAAEDKEIQTGEKESKSAAAPAPAKKATRAANSTIQTSATSEAPAKEEKKTAAATRSTKPKEKKKGGLDIASYFKKDDLAARAGNLTVSEALEEAAEEQEVTGAKLGAQELRSARQPEAVTGGVMRSYQLEGLEWLISLYENGLNGILADEMGLGKTIQTISFLTFLRSKGTYGPFLVVAPMSTLSNWIDEFARWTPDIPTVLYHGSIQERDHIRATRLRERRSGPKFPVVCTSYEICMNDRKHLATMGWKFIIIDEGHRLKNLNCRLMRELKSYESANRLLITGTPLQNNLAELWSLLNFLMPDIFDQLESFESWFDFSALQQKGGHEQILNKERKSSIISSLHAILKPFLLRRIKADVESSLPKKREYILYAPLSTTQKELYREIIEGTSRTYLQNKVMERLTGQAPTKKLTRSSSLNPSTKRKAGSSGYSTPSKSLKSSRASTPGSDPRDLRGRRRRNYREADDNDEFEVPDEPEEVELTGDEKDAADRAKNLAIAKKEISQKKLQNPVMQLRLACNSPHNFYWPWPATSDPDNTLITSSGKMLLLNRLVPSLFERGHKILIFSQFKTQLDIIEDWATILHDWRVCRIDGNVAQDDRRAQIKAFNTDPAVRLFLLSTRAGGQGINLAAADTVILFDSDWNPQQDLQAQDRAHRIGQTRPVIVYRLATKGTIEQTLLEKADGKRRLEKLVIQKGKFKALVGAGGGGGGKGGDENGGVDELTRILTEDEFEKYEIEDDGGKGGKGQLGEGLLSERDLDVLTDRSEEAYRRAEKGLDGGAGFKVVEMTKGEGEDGGGVLKEVGAKG